MVLFLDVIKFKTVSRLLYGILKVTSGIHKEADGILKEINGIRFRKTMESLRKSMKSLRNQWSPDLVLSKTNMPVNNTFPFD